MKQISKMMVDDLSELSCIESTYDFGGSLTCDPSKRAANQNQTVTYPFATGSIAWPSDTEKFKKSGYKDEPNFNSTLVIPPPFWRVFPQWANGYNQSNFPDISTLTRFQVWMRTAGLPTFRKLWGLNDKSVLPRGTWQIDVVYRFDPGLFSGTKSIVISTVSILGGKNPFLGIAYVVVGTICWVLGIVLLLRHMIKPRKLGDYQLLSWNQPSSKDGTGAQ